MKSLTQYLWLGALGLALGLGSGCKKQVVVAPEPALSLPGAKEVMAAVEKKDYDGAMAALMKVKDAATTEEQNNQFTALLRETKTKVIEIGGDDPKAAEFAGALRTMITGR